MSEPVSTQESPTTRSRIAGEFGTVFALVIWALAVTSLLDRSAYGLTEALARDLLLLWSAADQVPMPIVTLSLPDVRTLFLLPAGVVFSGSLLAAKCVGLLVHLAGVIAIFRWRSRDPANAESALLATGVLLISPLSIHMIDTLDPALFVGLALVLGVWAEHMYHQSRARFGGWYFAQAIVSFLLVDLHPAGLAYPLWLGLRWMRRGTAAGDEDNIIPGRERTHVLIGVALASLLGLFCSGFWPRLGAERNPLLAMGQLLPIDGLPPVVAMILGGAAGALVLALFWFQRRSLREDGLGTVLGFAWLISLISADATTAYLGLLLLLHWGFRSVLDLRLPVGSGFLAQRGIGFAVLIALCSGALISDRSRLEALRGEPVLSAQDDLIDRLARKVQEDNQAEPLKPGLADKETRARTTLRVASQWPGRTMLACRCNALPLPPAMADSGRFAANLAGIRYVIFDPRDPVNRPLVESFAVQGGNLVQTLALERAGVLLAIHAGDAVDHPPPAEPGPPPAPPK